MAWLTGKVQQFTTKISSKIEVGTAFARQDSKGRWFSLTGQSLKSTKVINLLEKVQQKKSIEIK